MSRPINYNDWFYKYHRYVTGTRDGLISYNDTKWKNINDRLLPLVQSESTLIGQQPFAVVGNNYGFDKLLNLMQDSNYTFNDINDALVDAYRYNYKNAMSRMVVNTHAVICSVTNKDKKNIRYDARSNYYIIDVPYDQMHFGERDEFIRQKLQDMHVKSTNVWIHITDMVNNPIYKEILEFSILITMNGLICNDCMVAFDDKGMMFKVRWKHSSDFRCIVYKLDTSHVYSFDIPVTDIAGSYLNIPWSKTGYVRLNAHSTLSGIVDIYYPEFVSSMNVCGNFCYIDGNGIHIPHIQNATNQMITDTNLKTIHITVYELKYFFEIPNIYPAMNYYNMMETNLVKTSDGDGVSDHGERIFAKVDDVDYTVHISTPPICIDRDSTTSYELIKTVSTDRERMTNLNKAVVNLGYALQQLKPSTSQHWIDVYIIEPIETIYNIAVNCHANYLRFAVLTTMVDQSMIRKYDEVFAGIKDVYDWRHSSMIINTQPDIFFGNNYQTAINNIYSVLDNEMFDTVKMFNSLTDNFITPAKSTRFNRPVSEQCFIVLKYDIDDNVWLFDYPEIKHFNGIQNAFYIDSGITGKEIYKFFLLYTDTEAPGEKNIEPMDESVVFDFDKFCEEIHNHQGYIKYWSVENKLLKMSDVMFNTYDGTTCVALMSKMLKHKIDDSLVTTYPSDINYEASGISTLGEGNEDSLESPFTINYLFYTLQLFYNQNDTFLSYFLYRLTHDNYSERYNDIDISSVLNDEDSHLVNYSYLNIAPETIQSSTSALYNADSVYDGLPFVVNGSGTIINTPYRYVFNDYTNIRYYLLDENSINKDFYIGYDEPDGITDNGGSKDIYNKDIEVARMLTHYMSTVHDMVASFKTGYQTSFNQTKLLNVFRDDVRHYRTDFAPYLNMQFEHPNTHTIINDLFGNHYDVANTVFARCTAIVNAIKSVINTTFTGKSITLYSFIQDFNGLLKSIYVNYGFKDYAVPSVRKLYIHLKKVNLTMNLYEFKKWLDEIDYDLISNIENYVGNNTLYPYNAQKFDPYKYTFNKINTETITRVDNLRQMINGFDLAYTAQFETLRDYVYDIVENYIFNMYRMHVEYEEITCNGKPIYAKITFPESAHTTHPITGDVVDNAECILYPKYESVEVGYSITSLTPICEYAFFDNTPIDTTIDIVTENGTVQTNATITFIKVGSSADMVDSFELLNNLNNTKVDIQNIHETFTVENNLIVNSKYADMNYELLIGNKFNQLPHVSELVLDRESKLPGSIDRIYASNQMINDYAIEYYGGHHSSSMYFKPSQVLHLPVDENGVVESVYGPYAVGQRIYLETEDNEYRFPVVITTIDHSQSRGFIEAIVDNAEWFEVKDLTKIQDYLNNDIECHVIPDNVSNFLNEYNDTTKISYDIIELTDIPQEELYYFPGDPIFVQNNANYVYTRLNWMINDNIENRFIDDEHKQYQFKYLGDYQIYGADFDMMPKVENVERYYDSLRYLLPDSWYDICEHDPIPLEKSQIGTEHELVMPLATYHGYYNTINLSGEYLGFCTIYVVFKRTDGTPMQPVAGINYPANVIGCSTTNLAEGPSFVLAVKNDVDDYDKIVFYTKYTNSSDPFDHSIVSDVTADDYHVIAIRYKAVHSGDVESRVVDMFIDGTFIDTIDDDYDFPAKLGVGIVASFDDLHGIGSNGTMHFKFISVINEVQTDADIAENSAWLYSRYCDPATKQITPIYDSFRINMINHNVDPMTLSELYPVLRSEPDDHDVWDGEVAVFESKIESAKHTIATQERGRETFIELMEAATTTYLKNYYIRKIEECDLKISYWNAYIKRLEYYKRNLEKPSTWYNVGSYNAALVYIENGRAEIVSDSLVECITDLPYTDKLELYMYDYQNHVWVMPDDYTITTSIVDGVKFDNPGDYSTNNVLHSIDVELLKPHITQKLLVYIGFNKSDIFTDITPNPSTCNVRFKPLLSINRDINNDIYSEINIRKHFDGCEKYRYTEDNLPNDIDRADILEGFMVVRPKPNGKYTSNPVYRFKDMSINQHSYENFDFYIPMEFKNVRTNESSDYPTYSCTVNVPIDSYQTDTTMTLICVEDDKFNGNVSTLTFEAISGNDLGLQSFTITKCSDSHLETGSYICTVLSSSSAYKSCGGLITVEVTKNENEDFKCGNWMKLNNPKYHIIPERFIVSCPTEGGFPYNVEIKNTYYNDQGKWMEPDNSRINNPYQYYFDTGKHVRYPLSDTRHNNPNVRLTIDTHLNDNIELVKAPYIGICRYSLDTIPEDGIIDMTGSIPTPLSRARYEFWVNGRCIKDDKSLHILSPTSIQLCNLNSLRNFECIELVNDIYDSDLLPHGNVYVDLYGNYYHTNTYESFLKMMINNRYIVDQRIDYIFYNMQHDDLYEYTKHVIPNPNNHNDEPNILDGLRLSETRDYRKFIHQPTLNGVTLYNLSIKELGLREIDNRKILDMYDKVWRHEAITNPYIPLHHTTEILNIPVIQYTKDIENDCYHIKVVGQYDGFFTIFISSSETADIDSVTHTIQIIPFVNCGIEIVLEDISKYEKKYVRTTAYSQPKKLN